jgi:hypothetical protein
MHALTGQKQGSGHTGHRGGVIPELGGGAGLNLGKDRAEALVASFGGRVTSAVSGRTTHLLVGAEPGAKKVGAAAAGGAKLLDLKTETVSLPAPSSDNPRVREAYLGAV